MLTPLLKRLLQHQDLTVSECQQALTALLTTADPIQSAAFLALLQAKPATATELSAFVVAMRKQMTPVPIAIPLLDIVGTGGDNVNTINISTAASLVAASCGIKVAKHGNRAVSSQCGSADVLAALGVDIEIDGTQVAQCIEEVGIGFCFAPRFHPAMAKLRAIRKALALPTIFNLVGPLLNPAQAQYYVMGVAHPDDMLRVAHTLSSLHVRHAFVVHSAGLDELTLLAPATLIEVMPSELVQYTIDPLDYGFKRAPLTAIQGGDASTNAQRIQAVLAGEKGPLADTIILNAGLAIYAANQAESFSHGIELARAALDTGATQRLLTRWQQFNKPASATA